MLQIHKAQFEGPFGSLRSIHTVVLTRRQIQVKPLALLPYLKPLVNRNNLKFGSVGSI